MLPYLFGVVVVFYDSLSRGVAVSVQGFYGPAFLRVFGVAVVDL